MAKKPYQWYLDAFKDSGYTEEEKIAAAKQAYKSDINSTYTGKRPANTTDSSKVTPATTANPFVQALQQRGLGALASSASGVEAVVANSPSGQAERNAAADAELYNNPAALAERIVASANTSDPTANNTVTPQAISPITNQPIGTYVMKPEATYSAGGYSRDFLAGGLTSEYDSKYNRYYIAKTDQYGVKHEVAIIGDPNNPGAYRVVDKLQAIQDIINQYKTKPNGIAQLKIELWNKGLLKGSAGQASIAARNQIDKTFAAALATTVDELTATNFNNADSKQFKDLNGLLTATTSYAGTRTSTNYNYTPKEIAASDITAFIQENLGRGATAKEVAEYTKALQEFERSHPQKSVVTTDALGMERNRVTYSGASEQDKAAVKVAVLAKSLSSAGVDPSSISKAGGAIAQGMSQLKETAAAYGIVGYDDSKALNTMIGLLKPGGNINAEKEKMKQLAKVTYKNLGSALDSGLTVKDVADQYSYYNQKILEKPGVTDVFDPLIQTALQNNGKSGLMSTDEYVRYLKNQPEWAKTQNAREEAASYATTILKQFGLIA